MRQQIHPDADAHGRGPAAAVHVFMQEELGGDRIGDQRERSGGRRHQAQVEMIQREQQREECQREKADAGEERAGR